MSEPRLRLSLHAQDVLRERCIPEGWVWRVVTSPEMTLADARDPHLIHALARIPENEGRVLRVIYNPDVGSIRVVTAFFDRTMRGKL